MLPVTYGYARVSKADDEAKNLETQLEVLADHGIREDFIFSDVASGRTMNRSDWLDLMSRVQPGDTIGVAFLDRFSRTATMPMSRPVSSAWMRGQSDS